jgi:hypothetical protein
MRFLMLIHLDDADSGGAPPASMIEAVEAFREDTSAGRIVDDGGLLPPSTGLLVRTGSGQVSVMDGPFAETKELIGGFFVVESPSAESMEGWARGFVQLHAEHWPVLSFVAEIRQIAEPPHE